MNPREALVRHSARLARWHNEKTDSQYVGLRNSRELRGIPDQYFPKSIVVIPDGNRRYAKTLGESKEAGHEAGAQKVVDLLRAFSELPIESVTVWGFSADNWKRDPEEVKYIMKLMNQTVADLLPELMERNGRLIHLGRKDRIPTYLAETLIRAEHKTNLNTGQIAGLAIDFGGEDQMERIKENVAKNPSLAQKPVSKLVDGWGIIKPADLLIRTGEEQNGLVHTSDIGWLNGKPTLIQPFTKQFPNLTRKDIAVAIQKFAISKRSQGA